MKRFLVGLAMLCAPIAARAQYVQEQYTSDYSIRTFLTKVSDFEYQFNIQFRNETLYNPGRFYGITDLYVFGVGHHYTKEHTPETEVGPVYIGDLPSYKPMRGPIEYSHYPFSVLSDFGDVVYFSTDMPFFLGGFGLIGCASPVVGPETFLKYSGSTCASAGFTGWKQIKLLFHFYEPTLAFDGAGLHVQLVGKEDQRQTVDIATIVTPEPATWALLAVGMLSIGLVRRKVS